MKEWRKCIRYLPSLLPHYIWFPSLRQSVDEGRMNIYMKSSVIYKYIQLQVTSQVSFLKILEDIPELREKKKKYLIIFHELKIWRKKSWIKHGIFEHFKMFCFKDDLSYVLTVKGSIIIKSVFFSSLLRTSFLLFF